MRTSAGQSQLAPILDRLGLDRSNWVKTVRDFGRMFKQVVCLREFAHVGGRRVARDGGFREGRRPKPLLFKDAD